MEFMKSTTGGWKQAEGVFPNTSAVYAWTVYAWTKSKFS